MIDRRRRVRWLAWIGGVIVVVAIVAGMRNRSSSVAARRERRPTRIALGPTPSDASGSIEAATSSKRRSGGEQPIGAETPRAFSEIFLRAQPGLGSTVRGRVRFVGGAPPWPPVKIDLQGNGMAIANAVLVDDERFEFADVVSDVPLTIDITAYGRRWWHRSFLLGRGELEEIDAQLVPTEPEPPVALDGSVSDSRGHPVAAARVSIADGGATETNLAGRFSLVREQRQCSLSVAHADHPTAQIWVCPPAQQDVRISITLADSHAIEIEVVDETGAPMPSLDVSCTARTADVRGGEVDAAGTTGEDGRVVLTRLVADRWTCRAYRPGYDGPTPQSVWIDADHPVGRVQLHLARWRPVAGGESIRGRVVADDGESLTGVRVTAEAGGHWVQVAALDATGRFDIPRLPAGAYTVTARADDHTSTTIPNVFTGTTELAIPVYPPGRLRLQVVDADTGDPIPGASVDGYGYTDRGGRFLFEWLPREPVKLHIWAAGYAESFAGPFQGEPGATVDGGVVRLRRGGVVRGRVLDPDGRPRGGLWVWACPGNVSFYLCEQLIHQKTLTRKTGEFVITGLTTRRWHIRSFDDDAGLRVGELVDVIDGRQAEALELILGRSEWTFQNHEDGVESDGQGKIGEFRSEWFETAE